MTTINITREFIEEMSLLPAEDVKVYLALCERSQLQETTKMGLTASELSRLSGVHTSTLARSLQRLDVASFLMLVEKSTKTRVDIELARDFVPKAKLIPFTWDNTDETKIAKVEAEMRRLVRQQQNPSESGLASILQGEPRDIVVELENKRGTALSSNDIWNLASMMSKFGPERTKKTIRQMYRQRDPIRAAYGALLKGAKGQSAKQSESEPFQTIKVRDLD